jgi:hypothetical protein
MMKVMVEDFVHEAAYQAQMNKDVDLGKSVQDTEGV